MVLSFSGFIRWLGDKDVKRTKLRISCVFVACCGLAIRNSVLELNRECVVVSYLNRRSSYVGGYLLNESKMTDIIRI